MAENYIVCESEKGNINISEDVIAVMTAAALAEVDGVAGMANTIGDELADFLGRKSLAKGVKLQINDDGIEIDVLIMVRYGCSIAQVAAKVQEEVASAVESMAGVRPSVNVHVTGVAFDKQ